MLLSIIIPSFQQGLLLRGALASIEQQIFKDYEVLILDGGSRDETAAVVGEFKHLPITYHSAPDKGIYDAMNKGVERSSGEFLYFMGCDDRLASPNALQDIFGQRKLLQNHVIYGDVIFAKKKIVYDGYFTAFKLIRHNICHQALFVRKVVFDKLGVFNVHYKVYADWEFNMRWFGASWVKKQYVPVIVAYYNEAGFSSDPQDEYFFRDLPALEKKYFPRIVKYLSANPDRPLHTRTIRLLSKLRIF